MVSSWPSKPAQAGSMPVARSIQTFVGQEFPESATEGQAEFLRGLPWGVRDPGLGCYVVCPSAQAVWQHRGCQPTEPSRSGAAHWDMRQARRFRMCVAQVGRAMVSKTIGWRFEAVRTCQFLSMSSWPSGLGTGLQTRIGGSDSRRGLHTRLPKEDRIAAHWRPSKTPLRYSSVGRAPGC